jgi:flagellar hook-associated protein 3 FlgL
MGILRVTQGIIAQRMLNNLQNQSQRILDLQTQLATGLRVNSPSDSPIDARRAINTRSTITKNEQYLRNISIVSPRLEETVTAIQTMSDNLLRARELTIQGANGTNDQVALDAIAEEINQILEAAVNTANHQTGSLYIFGGTRTNTLPYDVTRDANGNITAVTYQGNAEKILVNVGDGLTVPTNEVGSTVFQSSQDIFQVLIDIRDNLFAGDQGSLQNARLTELESARQQLSQAQSRVGAVQNRLARTETEISDFQVQLQELLSDSIDADFADVMINLNMQSNAFQAALSAGARIIQPSLLDFLG